MLLAFGYEHPYDFGYVQPFRGLKVFPDANL